MPFSGLASSKLKKCQTNLRVGYVYIEESFDTIFNMGYGGGVQRPPPMDYGSGKSPMDERVTACIDETTHLSSPSVI